MVLCGRKAPSSSPRPQHPAAFHWPPPLHRHLSESLCHLPISDPSTPGPGGLGFRTPYCVGSRAAYPVWARRSPGNRLCSCKACRPGSFGAWPSPFLLQGLFQIKRWGKAQRLPSSRPKGKGHPSSCRSEPTRLAFEALGTMVRGREPIHLGSGLGDGGGEPGRSLRRLGLSKLIWSAGEEAS